MIIRKPTVVTQNHVSALAVLLALVGGCNDIKQEEKPSQTSNSEVSVRKEPELDRRLLQLEKELFNKHLLITIDELSDVYEDAYKVGKALSPQVLLSKRLTPEIFPVLWDKVFLDKPDKVIVSEYTRAGEFANESDFGRGLRLILRKKVGELKISTILFLDYNEKTKKLEFPQDFFFNDKRKIIPDVMRVLMEYDEMPTREELEGYRKGYTPYQTKAKFFGTTISAEVDDRILQVIDFHIYPTKDAYDEEPIDIDGKTIPVVSLLRCMECHHKNKNTEEGFVGAYTSFEEFQRTLHLPSNQDTAIKSFLEFVSKKHFDSPEEKSQILTDLETKLRNPRENLSALLPTGFLEALEKKQSTFTHPSSVLNRYRIVGSQAITSTK